MKVKVYFGLKTQTEDVDSNDLIAMSYPEIYVMPSDIYETIKREITNMKLNNVDELHICTMSPIVLRTTEIIELKETVKLDWYMFVNNVLTRCNLHENIYAIAARPLQDLENMQYDEYDI